MVPFLIFLVGLLGVSLLELRTAYRRDTMDSKRRRRLRSFALLLAVASVALVDYLPTFGVHLYPFGYLGVLAFLLGATRTVQRYSLVDLTPAFAAEEILDTMADPLLVCDVEGRIQVNNAATSSTLGFTEQELRGRRLVSLAADREQEGRIQELLGGKTLRGREARLQHRDGDPIEVSLSGSPLVDGHGRLAGAVVLARDIRQRKRIEAALRESERHFRALIENGTDVITVMAPDGTILYESPSIERVLGFSPEERVGRSVLDRVHPEDRDGVAFLLENMVAEPDATITEEIRLIARDGSPRVLEVRARNLLHEPAVGAIVANSRDVTQSRRLENELRQRHRLEAVGRLAGGVAHDFNNLLTAVQGHVFMLEEHDDLPADARAEVEAIRQGTDRAAELTEQLLAFTRQQVRRPAVVDLNEVVHSLRPLLHRLLGAGIELELALHPDRVLVRADASQLDQIIMNIVLNAQDAMPDGGRVRVATGLETLADAELDPADGEPAPPGTYAVLRVADTGRGMDEATRARIFEPFFTTKRPGEGPGLGLSTVYGIVKQSGGAVRVDTAPERGATVHVFLPRATDGDGADDAGEALADGISRDGP